MPCLDSLEGCYFSAVSHGFSHMISDPFLLHWQRVSSVQKTRRGRVISGSTGLVSAGL